MVRPCSCPSTAIAVIGIDIGKNSFGFREWPWQGWSDVSQPVRRIGLPQHHVSREKGIGAWSDAEIKRAIAQGIRRTAPLKPPMGLEWYARMTDADLSAIVAYLRTVPPRE